MYGFVYEVNGDYSFKVGPGTLKLIGLRKFDHEPINSIAILDFLDDAPSSGVQVRPRRAHGRMDRARRI